MPPRIAAIVPMRHSSERVPGKNYRPFAGRPLFHRVIETLLSCPSVTTVVIDTDSQTIRDDAAHTFPDVVVFERPERLRANDIPMNAVLLNDVQQLDADLYLQTHSTNPLLRAATVESALKRFLAESEVYDSAFGVTRLQTRLWDGLTRPINHNPAILLRTQDLPPVFEENSCFYLFSRTVLERHRNRLGARPLMVEVPRDEALDIDEELDFRLAEAMFKEREARS